MKASLLVVGVIVLLVSAFVFFKASSDLKRIEQIRDSVPSMGFLLDALGNAAMRSSPQWKAAYSQKTISLGGMAVGGILVLVGLNIRQKRSS